MEWTRIYLNQTAVVHRYTHARAHMQTTNI